MPISPLLFLTADQKEGMHPFNDERKPRVTPPLRRE